MYFFKSKQTGKQCPLVVEFLATFCRKWLLKVPLNVSELEWKRIERGCTYTYSQLTLKWMSLDCGRCTTDL